MYSKTSEAGNYLKRVASHATKPRANGRVDDIPRGAKQVDINSINQQYFALVLKIEEATQAKDLRKARLLEGSLNELMQQPDVKILLEKRDNALRAVRISMRDRILFRIKRAPFIFGRNHGHFVKKMYRQLKQFSDLGR